MARPAPDVSTHRAKRGKRSRQDTRDQLVIEEISPDDMGYDGDIEVVRPDQYEDPASDLEDETILKRLWADTDDELAGGMRRLSCDTRSQSSPPKEDSDRGRKRQSKEADTASHPGNKKTEIEVSELVDEQDIHRPHKRRRKRSRRPNTAHRLMTGQEEAWSDSSERFENEDQRMAGAESSSSATVCGTPAGGDHEAMDMN